MLPTNKSFYSCYFVLLGINLWLIKDGKSDDYQVQFHVKGTADCDVVYHCNIIGLNKLLGRLIVRDRAGMEVLSYKPNLNSTVYDLKEAIHYYLDLRREVAEGVFLRYRGIVYRFRQFVYRTDSDVVTRVDWTIIHP